MPTTTQMFTDYPEILLQVIAELRGAFLDAADSRREAVELLSAQITDPTSILMAYQELVDYHAQAQTALERLISEGGEMVEAQFSREFGGIRQMGPAKLEREMPWHHPESVAELLYYYALIGRGFKGAGQNAHTIVYIPSDVSPWLPNPTKTEGGGSLPVIPAPPPPAARMLLTEDALIEDVGTLLGFLHTDSLRLSEGGRPQAEDVARLTARLQHTALAPPSAANGNTEQTLDDVRIALLLHLANRMGWLRLSGNQVRLTGNRVYAFLEQTRAEQRFALWDAWRNSTEWNDLCRTPSLHCTETGNWANDPHQTREAVLDLLRQLQPGAWYSGSDVIAAIKAQRPDFQRPTGDYESWYIRNVHTQEFLKGFEHWDEVEGALLRFLFSGPLYWLSALDLAEPSAGDDLLISLSGSGARWLDLDAELPNEPRRRPIVVEEDFRVKVPLGTPLSDRFRVERFAGWQASYPQFSYQINQRSLSRAAEEGIPPQRVLDFLRSHCRQIPEKVEAGLMRFAEKQKA
ncbi:MAG: hypothetical protein KF893_20490 [Caldilineaceae bacterium]|nr:hypothetical protein [Caldilineaceae bacterium]